MGRKSICWALCALTLAFCGLGHAQDSPSLGELARQAQKNKSGAPAKKVFTNEDFPSAPAAAPAVDSGVAASAPGSPDAPPAAGKTTEPTTAQKALDHMESIINQMDPLDRAALAKLVLEGVDKNFPGRTGWEERLFAAKQVYVSQGRDFIRKAKGMLGSAAPANDAAGAKDSGAKGPGAPDPGANDQSGQIQSVVQYGARIEAAFQEVITEGRDLAAKAPAK